MKETIIILLFILLLGGFLAIPNTSLATNNNTDALSTSAPGARAVHKISFTTNKNIPASGSILITFPALKSGDTNVSTSPSTSTFQLNNLANTDVKVVVNGTDISGNMSYSSSNPSGAGVSPKISLGLNSATSITAGSDVIIYLGCRTLASGACTNTNPVILNPLKTAATGVADIWRIQVNSLDPSSTSIETGFINVATDDTVTVKATVEPFLSFIIQGTPDATSMNSANTCGSSHNGTVTNAGSPTSSTNVNLGVLGAGVPNFAAQQMSISSNAINGYVITATGEGKLTNPGSGATIANIQGDVVANDNPVPAPLNSKIAGFGVHICDTQGKVSNFVWGQAVENFANPSPTFAYTLVSSTTPPGAQGDKSMLLYGVVITDTTPGGTYKTSLTYTATPLF